MSRDELIRNIRIRNLWSQVAQYRMVYVVAMQNHDHELAERATKQRLATIDLIQKLHTNPR